VFRHSRWIVLLGVLAATAVLPADAAAQRRRAGVRRPVVRPAVYVAARPYYYRPYYRPFWYGGYAGWYSGYGWYPYGFYQPYPYGRYYDYRSAARVQVEPRNAEVFIDGYFVGTVDDFDGWLQRLHVMPGEHQVQIYLPGHRTFRQNVLFRPGATIRLEHVMEPLGPGEPEESRPAPGGSPAPSRPAGDVGVPAPRREPPVMRPGESREYGSLAIRVQPVDAEVLVDGEPWESPEAGSLLLQLSEGTHQVEVRKEGFRTYSAQVDVRRGRTTSVNVSLSRQ
jgi:hypothetical protein